MVVVVMWCEDFMKILDMGVGVICLCCPDTHNTGCPNLEPKHCLCMYICINCLLLSENAYEVVVPSSCALTPSDFYRPQVFIRNNIFCLLK